MNDKIEKNYAKLVEAFLPLIKQAAELRKSVEPMTNTVVDIQKSIKPLADTVEITNNLTNAIIPLIKTIQINNLGLQSREIAELVDAGKLERVKHGYYRFTGSSDVDSEAKLISQLYPDGIICMTTALFYYGYSNRTPLTWDIAVDRNTSKARFNIDYPYVKPYYIDKAHLEYGITEAVYEDYILKIFDRDRLICECIKHENKMDREIYNKAILAYINDNQKNITNLLDYAKHRNIHKKVRERIGMWL